MLMIFIRLGFEAHLIKLNHAVHAYITQQVFNLKKHFSLQLHCCILCSYKIPG